MMTQKKRERLHPILAMLHQALEKKTERPSRQGDLSWAVREEATR